MQQQFTKEFIYERIKDSGFPCWNLGFIAGFRNVVNVQSYFGNDWTEDDTDETKIEKSLAQLENTLSSSFPDNTIFTIEIRAARTASGNSILGPFQFTKSNIVDTAAEPTPELTQQPAQQSQLGIIPAGYVPEAMLKGLEDQLTKNFEARIDALKAEQKQEQREQEYKNRLERLEEREKEVKDLEKSYKSDVAKGADVVVEIIKKIGAYFLMPKNASAAAINYEQAPQLGEVQDDKKANAVDEFAAFLYNNSTIEEIQELQKQYKNVKMAQQNTAASNAAASNAATC